MKRISPGQWLLLGFLGFPIISLVSEVLGWVFFALVLGVRLEHGVPQFGWGGLFGFFLGAPLGTASALVSYGWTTHQYFQSRAVAIGSALLIGGFWLRWLLQCDPFVWVGDFGFAVTPLAWAAGLLLFGILAKPAAASSYSQ